MLTGWLILSGLGQPVLPYKQRLYTDWWHLSRLLSARHNLYILTPVKAVDLKAWRDDAGLSQSGLASQLQVSVNTVARWERDEIAIPPYLELALAELKHRIAKEPVTPSSAEYIRRVMREQNLSPRQVVERAERAGYKLSNAYLHNLLVGASTNPSLSSVYAVAEGIGRPAEEVVQAFADVIKPRKAASKRAKSK